MKDLLRVDLEFPYQPCLFFLLFLAANSLLTFVPFSPAVKIWIFLLGLLTPLLIACCLSAPLPVRQKPSFQLEPFKKFSAPLWIWSLLLIVALLLRFMPLINPGLWLIPDDALIAQYTLDLDRHWHWRIFETMTQGSSLPTYLSWPIFKITHSMPVAMHFPPTCFSFIAVPMAYLAARRFFPPTVSFIFLV